MLNTYISKVNVDLWAQAITLEWTGPEAAQKPKGPFHCAPGKGLAGINCDNVMTSRLGGTNCTPKGDWRVLDHWRCFEAYPEAEWVTVFHSASRGIGLHYYPVVPQYPASHGCIRIADYAIAKLIWEHTRSGVTLVSVQGELRPQPVMLRCGDRGANVRKLQRQLTERGYPVSIDSDFGLQTQQAVKQFQRDMNLALVDGIFGRATYNKLFGSCRVLAHA